MILMDLEKHQVPSNELDDLLNKQQTLRPVHKDLRKRRLRRAVVHGVGLLASFVFITTLAHIPRSWNFWDREVSLHPPRRPLSLREREDLFLWVLFLHTMMNYANTVSFLS